MDQVTSTSSNHPGGGKGTTTESKVTSLRSRSSRSSRSKVSSIIEAKRVDAVASAAALKAKLKFLDKEQQARMELEQKQAELDKLITIKELNVAEAQINALEALTQDDSSSSLVSLDVGFLAPETNKDEYVQQYVQSLSNDTNDISVNPPAPFEYQQSTIEPLLATNHDGVTKPRLLAPTPMTSPQLPIARTELAPSDPPSSFGQEFNENSIMQSKDRPVFDVHVPAGLNPQNREFVPQLPPGLNPQNREFVPQYVTQTLMPRTTQFPSANTSAQYVPWSPPTVTNRSTAQVRNTHSDETTPMAAKPLYSESRDFEMVDLAKTMAEQVHLARLPPPEPGVFYGNPLSYPAWQKAFSVLVAKSHVPLNERIYYLKRYLGGSAKEAVEGYFLIPSADTYQEAMDLLHERFGNQYVVAEAFRDKLDDWPKIGNKDGLALRKFADFLRQCNTGMQGNDSLNVLNDAHEIRKLMTKLPDWMTRRWVRLVTNYKEKSKCFPPFNEFVKFVVKEAEIACEPITVLKNPKLSMPQGPSKEPKIFSKTIQPRLRSLATETVTTCKTEVRPCLCCGNNHKLDKCLGFLRKSLQERKDFIKTNGLCYGCMRKGHRSKECKHRLICETCKKKHPSALHGDTFVKTEVDREPKVKSERNDGNAISHASQRDIASTSKCTMIVPVWISHQDNPHHERMVYALLDTQSDTTFILEDTCKALGVSGTDVKLMLSTMSANRQMIDSQKIVGLQVRAHDSSEMLTLPDTYTRGIMPANRSHIPTPHMARKWPHLEVMADKLMPLAGCEVGLLIGYNCSQALAPREVIPPQRNEPYGQRTDLGWGIVGIVNPTEVSDEDPIGFSHRVMVNQGPDMQEAQVQFVVKNSIKEVISPQQVIKWMELDFYEQKSENMALSQEDRKFLQIVDGGIKQMPDQHYQMPLPFREVIPKLPNNRVQASQRLQHLKRRFQKDPKYCADYKLFMSNVIQSGFAEPVPEQDLDTQPGCVWYIPHHGVYNARKPDKIRVVFDCSAKFRGESLNNRLFQGPDLTNALIGVLCRFRREYIAFMCDVEQMFFQFTVAKEHRNYLRFLWWNNGEYDKQPREYRMNVHLFGAVSSPACANFGLRRIADDNEAELGDAAANFIRQNFYVDDGLASVPTPQEAIQLIDNTKKMCARGGLRLHKFVSNSKGVMASVPHTDRAQGTKDINLLSDVMPVERALGVQWCVESDAFQFRITLKDQPLTRRGILSTVSSIYDPLGFIAPVLLVGKQILQQMCRENADWDCPISESLRPRWERWRGSLFYLEQLKVKRCLKPEEFGKVKTLELHHFSDASTEGYGQCSYLRQVNEQNQVHCTLLMGKSRVTPLKTVTIPRLELTAAVVSVRASNFLKRELELIQDIEEFYWTDSKIVLGYIRNESRRFHVYVANRVQQIRDHSDPVQWRHVKTNENPADAASRGITAHELVDSSKWFSGPEFLWMTEIPTDPVDSLELSLPNDDPEVKETCLLATSANESPCSMLERLEYFSSWSHAAKAIANVLNFKTMLRSCTLSKQKSNESGNNKCLKFIPANVEDLCKAEREIIKMVQQEVFEEELKTLRLEQSNDNMPNQDNARKTVKSTSSLYRLDPFVDADGILRVGGRIKKADVSLEMKNPVILPRKHHITNLIISHFHELAGHQGRGITTNELRSNGYWIIGCSAAVSSIITRCVTCRKLRSKLLDQKMADLPDDRLNPAPPFTFCAVDYFGPWLIKEGRKEIKRYGVLFTCMASRAIHIETANSMSTDSFINALRRFVSVRGPIQQLRSDRGSNFVGAEAELKRALSEMDHERVRQFLLKEKCDYFEFKMNVPSASHMGGVWERQIRTVRSVLTTLLSKAGTQLDDESLRTLMCEAAAIVNCRPLTVDNLNDPTLEPLTPNHLLTMKTKVIVPPPGEFQAQEIYSKKRWRRVQALANEFWTRWRKEFLQNLQVRQKWVCDRRDLQIGDVVILREDNVHRNQWRLGRVEETYPDEDNHVRKVKLLMGERERDNHGKRVHSPTYLDRPIQKLVLLVESPTDIDV